MVSLHSYLSLYTGFLLTKVLNYYLLYFFLIHIFIAVLGARSFIGSRTMQLRNWVLFYFFGANIFCLLLVLLKMYLNFSLGAVYSFTTGGLAPFSDTLILLAITVTIISWVYLSERYMFRVSFFIFYFFIFVICTILMVTATDLLQVFIYFEFLFFPSLFFVYQLGYSRKVAKSILFLLAWTLTGSFLCFLAIAYIYSVYGTLEVSSLSLLRFSIVEKTTLFLVLFLGFGIKIPVWPFYYWLTKVHVEAPTGFSIFLSGFLVKTAFYVLSFFYFLLQSPAANMFVLAFVVWGVYDSSVRMWGSLDVKRLIALATVQEMNLIMLFLVLLGNASLGILNLFLLVHGLLSALFFFLIDQVQKVYGTRMLPALGGLSLFAPLLSGLLWAALLIFRGFPIFIKFLIEWELLSLLISNFHGFGVAFFFAITMFGVLGFSRVWFSILYGHPVDTQYKTDILKRDFVTGYFLVGFLFLLNFFFMLFGGWCFVTCFL